MQTPEEYEDPNNDKDEFNNNWDKYLEGYWTWRKIIDTLRFEIYFLKNPRDATKKEFETYRSETRLMLETVDLEKIHKDGNKSKKLSDLLMIRTKLTNRFEKMLKNGQIHFYPDEGKKKRKRD